MSGKHNGFVRPIDGGVAELTRQRSRGRRGCDARDASVVLENGWGSDRNRQEDRHDPQGNRHLAAHQISVVTGSLGFFALVYIMLRHEVPAKADRWLLGLGSVWVLATVIFEFVFGHFVMGHSWSRLLADYNILQGRLWTVVLAVVAVAPLAVKRIVTRRHGSARTVDQEHAATV